MRSAVKRLEIWQAIERYASNPTLAVSRRLLCRETGVPVRTLDHICHAFSGLSLIAYIKRRHMGLAHAMLQRAAPDATVTSIATFCGFSDLGRFAVRYHQRYGQPPSQTLRQPAEPIVAPPTRASTILHVPEDPPLPDAGDIRGTDSAALLAEYRRPDPPQPRVAGGGGGRPRASASGRRGGCELSERGRARPPPRSGHAWRIV